MTGILGNGMNQDVLETCVADAIDLVERLADFFETSEEIVTWIRSPNAQWGGLTPEQMLVAGRGIEIEQSLRRLESTSAI